jgi:hypothetical protein
VFRVTCIVIFLAFLVRTALCQDPGKNPPEKSSSIEPKIDPAINQKLMMGLAKDVPETKGVTVTWNVSRYGYTAAYELENVSYLTLYTRAGELVESFRKRPWDDRVPEIIRMEFDNSEYNSFKVIGFWESVNADNKHYFLQMLDDQSLSWSAWCDENGKFSRAPFIE